ncbi:MAG: CHAT domain-containing protein [Kofleriaceae bacterium]
MLARPPLQGRSDLLPPAMAWAFGAGVEPRPPTAPAKVVVVGDVVPPAELGLPSLAPVPVRPGEAAVRGAAATPAAVLAALADATYAELHVHGQVDLAVADASFLALSPGASGGWALTAAEVRRATLAAAPVVVLAACRAAEVAPFEHARWSLPDAFLAAGARAVIAPAVDIPDAEAGPFFDAVRTQVLAGVAPAVAVAAERAAAMARGQAWAASVVVFE